MDTQELIIYGVRGCRFCSAAINFAMVRGIPHTVVFCDDIETRKRVKLKYGHNTWPIIISPSTAIESEDKLIGGYTDLIAVYQEST